MRKIVIALTTLAVIAAGSVTAFADHFRTRIWIGPGWGPGWHGRHYYYPYPYPYVVEQPTVIVQPPEVYVQPALPRDAPPPNYYWYYCQNPPGYYPYVQSCPEGWMKVVPTPQPQEQKR